MPKGGTKYSFVGPSRVIYNFFMKPHPDEKPEIVAFCEECGCRMLLTREQIEGSPGYILCRECSGKSVHKPPSVPDRMLELRAGSRTFRMNRKKPILTLGRKSHNDLVVRSPNVSRTHAYIVFMQNAFTLYDFSLNGTCVRVEGEEEVVLKNENFTLSGRGVIQLGRSIDPDSKNLIRFQIRQPA